MCVCVCLPVGFIKGVCHSIFVLVTLVIDLSEDQREQGRRGCPPSLPRSSPLVVAAATTCFFPSPQTEALFVCGIINCSLPPSLSPSLPSSCSCFCCVVPLL